MKGWTGCIARLGVPNLLGVTWSPAAELSVRKLAPVSHLLPGGHPLSRAVGVIHAVSRVGEDVIATGTVNTIGAELIASGQWLPEVDLVVAESEGVPVEGQTVLRKAVVAGVVLGQLTVWDEGLWIRLNGPGGET